MVANAKFERCGRNRMAYFRALSDGVRCELHSFDSGRVQWGAVVKTVMNLRFPKRARHYLNI
jgi:hypothetical protein